MRRLLLVVSLLGLIYGCEPSVPEGIFECTADTDCPPDMVCRTPEERCYTTREPLPDGG